MQHEAVLTESEIGFLSEVFDEPTPALSSADGYHHMISVTTEVPQLVASLLGQVRQHDNVVAARISTCTQQRELLRRFLFQRHRQYFPALYKDLS